MNDTSTTSPYKFTEELLKVGDLEVDPRVQRVFNPAKAQTIFNNWNPAGLGVISVSRRNPVTMVIIDGQHRVDAARRITDNAGEVPCHVYDGLTLEQEAELFLLLNNTTKPRLIDKHKVQVTAGEEMAVEIDRLTREYGFKVDPQAGPANITAIGSLQRIWKLSKQVEADPNLITMTLLVVNRAWGVQENAARGVVLEGIAALFAEYGARVDTDILIRKLKDYSGGPEGLHDHAQTYAKLERTTVPMAVARLAVQEYNVGRRVNNLEPWRRRR